MKGKLSITWIKLSVDTFDTNKIRLMLQSRGGDRVFRIWINLLCLAGKKNWGGWVYSSKDKPYTIRELAKICNVTYKSIERTLNVLSGMQIVKIKKGLIYIVKWNEYQNIKGLDKIRQATKERVRRWREKAEREAKELLVLPVTNDNIPEDIMKSELINDVTLPVTPCNANIFFDYKKGKFQGLTPDYLKELSEKYPGVNVCNERDKMVNWLIDNPGKKRQGKRSFINNWLDRAKGNVKNPQEGLLQRLKQGDYNGK